MIGVFLNIREINSGSFLVHHMLSGKTYFATHYTLERIKL